MEMSRPSEEHLRLKELEGEWTGTETMHPSPWDPQGGQARAFIRNRVVLGGFNLLHEYCQERDGAVTFEGVGVFAYDPGEDQYLLYWFDSSGLLPPDRFAGSWKGRVLELTAENAMGHHRCRYELGEGRYSFRMEVSPDGEQWMTFLEGEYERAGP